MSGVSPDSLTVLTRRGPRVRAEAHSVPRTFRLSPAEMHRVKIAANLNYQTVSEFARDAIVTAAEDCLENVE